MREVTAIVWTLNGPPGIRMINTVISSSPIFILKKKKKKKGNEMSTDVCQRTEVEILLKDEFLSLSLFYPIVMHQLNGQLAEREERG